MKKSEALHKNNFTWWILFSSLTSLSILTRLYKIEEPRHVCWDETHFGKMASWYIKRTFFFDVHPPLGKMLIALSGYLTGYNGSFPFIKPGDQYKDTPYLGMRSFCALLGSALVPFSFLIVWEMSKSLFASSMAAILILYDTGTVTLTQYILLDPLLLFFIMAANLGIVKIQGLRNKQFSKLWWFWMVWTGTFLTCSISVKFVGLFVVLYAGINTAVDLWELLGNLQLSLVDLFRHFIARIFCLILLPIGLYMSIFAIHLHVLNKSGPGDSFYSSAFQSSLSGNSLFNATMPEDVAYGAIITIKNLRTGGGYLHSHWHLYPENVGARQQQVTAYSHNDDNNKWIIKKIDQSAPDPKNKKIPVELVRNGDLIRLEHLVTRRNLHSHREVAPVTKRHYQVTCYGENGTGDANDVWRIKIVNGAEKEVVKAIKSQLQLIHYFAECALHSHNKQLPKWGWEQMEVTCNPTLRNKNNVWNIEDNYFPRLPNVSIKIFTPGFWERFVESHAVMFQGNSGLKPKEGEVTSRPWQWPIDYRGQWFSGGEQRIYLLGNPVIWWGNLFILFFFPILNAFVNVREKRNYIDSSILREKQHRMSHSCIWLGVAWLFHYFPFFGMGRVLYYHHYFPAQLYNCMLSGIVLDYALNFLRNFISVKYQDTVHHCAVGIILSSLVYSFYLFSPLTYGMSGPLSHADNSSYKHIKWLDTWEF